MKEKTKITAEYEKTIFLTVAVLLILIKSKVKLIIPKEKKSERKAPKIQIGLLSTNGL